MLFQTTWPLFGLSNPLANFPATITDGTSNTIFFSEQYAGVQPQFPSGHTSLWWWNYNNFQAPAGADDGCGAAGYGYGAAYPPLFTPPISYCTSNTQNIGTEPVSVCLCRATSPHTGGINVGMADGSVRLVAQGISGTTWYFACTPNGGEVLGSDW